MWALIARMRAIPALTLALLAGAAFGAPKIFRKEDGTVCAVSVEGGQLVEACEAAPKLAQADAPRAEPRADLVPAVRAGYSGGAVDLIGSAANKFGWSGALKLAAAGGIVTGLVYLGGGLSAEGGASLAGAAIFAVAALLLDHSARGDLQAAGATGR